MSRLQNPSSTSTAGGRGGVYLYKAAAPARNLGLLRAWFYAQRLRSDAAGRGRLFYFNEEDTVCTTDSAPVASSF